MHCDRFPEWQGCECERDRGHIGDCRCVCGCTWNPDTLRMTRPGDRAVARGLTVEDVEPRVRAECSCPYSVTRSMAASGAFVPGPDGSWIARDCPVHSGVTTP